MGEIKKQSTNPGLDIEHLFQGGGRATGGDRRVKKESQFDSG